MSGYTPVFDSVFEGTLCGRWPTLPVWLTILPMADKNGHIDRTVRNISLVTGWPENLLQQAITELMEPDAQSRSESDDGRRLVLIDPENRQWGWRVVNIQVYRSKASGQNQITDGRNADKVRRYKERHRETPPDTLNTHSYSDADSYTNNKNQEGEGRAKRAPSANRLSGHFELTPERRAIAESEKVDPDREFAKFRDHWFSAGGQSSRKHDWDAAWRNWCRKAADFSHTGGTKSKPFHRETADELEELAKRANQ